ncbi:MAG: recombinase family protein [Bryobacteraceae bacterium]|jgi:DNA invertase Pin-like site-specific DNA recombinase
MKKKAPIVEAFGYIRVSGRGQLDGDGFPRQREAIQRYADANGFRIVRWFEERAVCGATEWENRPAWSEMAQHLNGVRTIIVERLDRLARELFIQEYILRDLKQRGVTLVSVGEQDLDSDPARVLFRQIMGAIGQYDRTMVVLKLRAARRRMKTSTGHCEGRKPYGARPGEHAVMERIRAERAAGRPFDAIAAALNTEGVPTRTAGRRWFGSTVAKIMRRPEVAQ